MKVAAVIDVAQEDLAVLGIPVTIIVTLIS